MKEVTAERNHQSRLRRVSTMMLVFSAVVLVLSIGYRYHLSSVVLAERTLALQGATKPSAGAHRATAVARGKHAAIDPSQQALAEDVDEVSVTSINTQLQTCYITIALAGFSMLCSGFAFYRS